MCACVCNTDHRYVCAWPPIQRRNSISFIGSAQAFGSIAIYCLCTYIAHSSLHLHVCGSPVTVCIWPLRMCAMCTSEMVYVSVSSCGCQRILVLHEHRLRPFLSIKPTKIIVFLRILSEVKWHLHAQNHMHTHTQLTLMPKCGANSDSSTHASHVKNTDTTTITPKSNRTQSQRAYTASSAASKTHA